MKGIKKTHLTEIKSLASPPQMVIHILQATFLLLGHSEAEVKDYSKIKRLLGQQTLLASLDNLSVDAVSQETALRAREICQQYSMDKARNVNFASAEFYRWNLSVIEAVLGRSGDEAGSATAQAK